MIRIRIDPYRLSKDDTIALVVDDESQFIENRLKIRDALHKRKDLNVVIKNRKIEQWYKSLRDYPDVKVEIVSPKSVLSKALNFPTSLSLNLPVNDSEIQELALIQKAKKHQPQTRLATVKDIESWMLSVCVGECWGKKGGTLSHLSEMASFFLQGKELQQHSALEKLNEKQKEQWFNSSVGEAYKWLFTTPDDRSLLIYAWQILKNYDENVREKFLDELTKNNRKVLEPIEKYLEQIPSCECSDDYERKSELSDLLEIRWNNILRNNFKYKKSEIQEKKDEVLKQRFKDIINEVIIKMSGKIAGEINALLSFVRENTFYFSKELFNLIGAKFSLFTKQTEVLSQLIPPEFPSEPLLDWDWNQISKWAIKYFRYKKWSLCQERRDKRVEKIAESYSEWLYRKYPELKNELSPLIYGTWHRIKRYLEQGCQILWIIIDNLPWFYLEDVVKAFKDQRLYCSSGPTLCLSMLPSETRISKTSLVAGKLPDQIEIDKYQNYKLLFEDFCKQNNIASYRSIPDSEFRKTKLEKHQITCCIINKLDVSSHGGFFDLEDEIKDFLRRIAKYVKDFLPLGIVSNKFYFVISTDHGSCIIPPNVKKLKEPQGAKVEKVHKRFVYTESESRLDENWYFLDKNKFGLIESVAIAKGYSYIGNRKPKGLVHGGMTPEETLVPYLEFCLKPLDVKAIQCFHSSSPIPIGTRKHKVELSIRNLNDYKISNITLYIPSHSIEIHIEKILAKDEVTQSVEIAISREELVHNKDDRVTLQGFYTFDCLGQSKRNQVGVEIKIRKIVDVSETVEKLFRF